MSEQTGHRGYYADCYVLSDNRTTEFIQEFLNQFLPKREERADEYIIPMYSDTPSKVIRTALELIEELCKNPSEVNTIYWSNIMESDLKGAMCFFTDDGKIIYGLYCNTRYENTETEDKLLLQMKKFIGSDVGLITYEEPPTHNSQEFLNMIKERSTL